MATDQPAELPTPGFLLAFLMLGHFSWDTHFMQFHKELFFELASLGCPGLWVDERPRLRLDRAAWLRAFPNGEVIRERHSHRLVPWSVSKLRLGHRFHLPDVMVARQITRTLEALNIRRPVIFVYTPQELGVAKRVDHALSVYWTGDEVIMWGHDQLLEYVDIILAVSPRALEHHRSLYPDKTWQVSTGVAHRMFDTIPGAAVPAELRHIPRPIAGYSGSLNLARIDAQLLRSVVDGLPAISFALVGPQSGDLRGVLADCKNVHFIAAQPYERVPEFLSAFDCGIVPYRLTEFNLGSNPLKVHEYLAAGLPVVSTPLPSLAVYDSLVRVAATPEEFIQGVEKAVLEREDKDGIAQRRSAADEYSTDKIAARILSIVERHIARTNAMQ